MTLNQDEIFGHGRDSKLPVQIRTNRTWFPILLGVVVGMFVWLILAVLETPSFYRLSVWITGKTSTKEMPRYYWILRSVLLILACAGGFMGVFYSQWPKKSSFIFLLAVLVVVSVFTVFGFQ